MEEEICDRCVGAGEVWKLCDAWSYSNSTQELVACVCKSGISHGITLKPKTKEQMTKDHRDAIAAAEGAIENFDKGVKR